MSEILQIFCTLISAVCLSLAIPNNLFHFGSALFALISLVPFYLVYTNLKSYRNASLLFGLHALAVHLTSSYWLGLFREMAAAVLLSSAFGTALIGCLTGIFFYLPFARFSGRSLALNSSYKSTGFSSFRIFWFTVCYTAYEWVKSSGFLGYPWGTVSSAMYTWISLCQIADITGRCGVTFLVVLFNSVLAEGIQLCFNSAKSENIKYQLFSYKQTAVTCCLLLLVSTVYGFYRISEKRPVTKYLNVVMVQQNADPWESHSDEQNILTSQRLTEEALKEAEEQNEKTDLIIWSEGVLRYPMPSSKVHYKNFPSENPLIPYIKSKNIPFLIGGPYFYTSGDSVCNWNSAFLFDEKGNFRGYYPKNHLVPFAEVLPFAENKNVRKFYKSTGIGTGWTPGNQYVLFEVKCHKPEIRVFPEIQTYSLLETYDEQRQREKKLPSVLFCTPICYDDSFPDICSPLANAGAELFINLTDNSWSHADTAEYQHFTNSFWRTIESRRTMVRSTNSGYSVVIDPTGKILADMPLFKEASIFTKVPVYQPVKTVYLIFGNWVAYLCVLSILSYAVFQYIVMNRPLDPPSTRDFEKQPAMSPRKIRRIHRK